MPTDYQLSNKVIFEGLFRLVIYILLLMLK